jgi:hypothetical protein
MANLVSAAGGRLCASEATMLDIALLATTVVAKFLVPFVQAGVDKVTQAVEQKFGKPASEQVTQIEKQLFDKVDAVFTGEDERHALELFRKKPAGAKDLLEEYLRDKLNADPALAEDFDKLINSKGPTGKTGAQIMDATVAVIFDNTGATLNRSLQVGNVFAADPGAALGSITSVPTRPRGKARSGPNQPSPPDEKQS